MKHEDQKETNKERLKVLTKDYGFKVSKQRFEDEKESRHTALFLYFLTGISATFYVGIVLLLVWLFL
jgi:hypothetical protein